MIDPLFLSLQTLADLQRIVDEGLEEGLTLDYKASPALSRESAAINELCKDVSAMANSAGGQIVYGIEEDKQTGKPKCIDGGVIDGKLTREWIIQILNARIQPRPEGITVERVPLSGSGCAFVISIPPTRMGPHQAPDKRYYKRFALHSVPMEDYEVRDVMNRDVEPNLFLDLSFSDTDSCRLTRPNPDFSDAFPVLARMVNLSRRPAFHAVARIYISDAFNLQAAGRLNHTGSVFIADLGMCHKLSLNVTAPPEFPMFRECPLSIGLFHLVLPTQSIATPLAIGWQVVAPGCDNSGIARLQYTSGTLVIRRPWAPKPAGPLER